MQNIVLENNRKPATHFIEVYKYRGKVFNSQIDNISYLFELSIFQFVPAIRTIAIFKIRLK